MRVFLAKFRTAVLSAAALMALLGLIGVATAQAQDMDAAKIKYRQTLMGSIGFHTASMGAILKGEWPKEDVAAHAKALAADLMLIGNAFKAQTADVRTDAKQDIWKEMGKFEEKYKAAQAASAKLAEVAAGGDMAAIGAQMKQVGEACGGCHKEFRKPKEQSYKN